MITSEKATNRGPEFFKEGQHFKQRLILDIGALLYEARQEKGLSLEEVSAATELPVKRIEQTEWSTQKIYFNRIGLLLKLYNKKLEIKLTER